MGAVLEVGPQRSSSGLKEKYLRWLVLRSTSWESVELKAGQSEGEWHPADANTLRPGKGEMMRIEQRGLVPSPPHTQGLPFSCREGGTTVTFPHLHVSPEMPGSQSSQVAVEHEEAEMLI